MSQAPKSSLYAADPTMMSRLDFPVGTMIVSTGKRVNEVFDDTDDGTGKIKDNEIFVDPDGVGSLIEIDPKVGNTNMFLSLFFRGILPTAEVMRNVEKKGKKKEKKYFSLAFDPEKIHTAYSEAECQAGCYVLEAFGDGDHCFIPEVGYRSNVVTSGDTHYFFDFHLSTKNLKEYPPVEVRHGGYEFMRMEVREAFYRMIQALRDRYTGETGKTHFFAIGKKSGFSRKKIEALWEKFMTQLEKLSHLNEANLEEWVRANEQYMVR